MPEAYVADFDSVLRAVHVLAASGVPCRCDVFHAQQTIVPVVTALENAAYEAMGRRERLERQAANHRRRKGRANQSIAQQLRNAKPAETEAIALADEVALLARWRDEVLAVAGPCHADRCLLYDFVVAELRARVPLAEYRLAPLCYFLDQHRDQLLAFAEQLDRELAALATDFHVATDTLRELLRLQALSDHNPRRWQREADLRRLLRERFHVVNEAVREVAEQTVRASSALENLNSRLRNYFTLRRHLGSAYLSLLQFFLNHRRFTRSDRPERIGKSPAELLNGQEHPHWLEMLGYPKFSRN
jgi:DNA repair exonuclease SbcCD ATPase subunit